MNKNSGYRFWIALIWLVSLAACSSARSAGPSGASLRVVATTTIVGDVVRNVIGDRLGEQVNLDVILPAGVDPHSFEANPQDMAKIAQADLIFMNGAGLEAILEPLFANAGSQAQVISLSEGLDLLPAHDLVDSQAGKAGSLPGDPHTWFDPNYVIAWVDKIEKILSTSDPAGADTYRANAQAYQAQLQELDAWITTQVAQVPQDNRKLVTDHELFTYFSKRYGFEQVGVVIPGYSTSAQPSAQELAQLEDAIRSLSVKAVFVGETVNPASAERVSQDTGIQLIYLYTEALTAPGGEADTYLDMMRYNVTAITGALR